MLYRSIGKTGGETLFVTIPAEIVRRLELHKGHAVQVKLIEGGFKVMLIRDVEEAAKKLGVEFDS